MSALRLTDQDAATLPFVAESYYKTHKETSLRLQARAEVTSNVELRELILSAATQVTQALAKRESDLVTPMARAAAYINPKYVYGEERFECPKAAECFAEIVEDYLSGSLKASQGDKAALHTEIILEAANFRKLRGWFATDAARRVASIKSEFDFGLLLHSMTMQRMCPAWHRNF